MSSHQWHGGKGGGNKTADKKQFDDNWDLIFGKKQLKENIMNRSELLEILHNNIANITFTKVNGDVRVLKGTLLEDFLPKKEIAEGVEVETKKATNENVVVAFDIESDGYRSFRVDSVTAVEIIEN